MGNIIANGKMSWGKNKNFAAKKDIGGVFGEGTKEKICREEKEDLGTGDQCQPRH